MKLFIPEVVRKRLSAEELAALAALEVLLPDEGFDELLRIAMSMKKAQLASALAMQALVLEKGDLAAARERLCRDANLSSLAWESMQ